MDPSTMQFGDRIRGLRNLQGLSQLTIAERLNVSVSYISKIENGKLHFGVYPSEEFIQKLAVELMADEDELLLLADKVPASIRQRIRQHPGLFRKLAKMDRQSLDDLEKLIGTP